MKHDAQVDFWIRGDHRESVSPAEHNPTVVSASQNRVISCPPSSQMNGMAPFRASGILGFWNHHPPLDYC